MFHILHCKFIIAFIVFVIIFELLEEFLLISGLFKLFILFFISSSFSIELSSFFKSVLDIFILLSFFFTSLFIIFICHIKMLSGFDFSQTLYVVLCSQIGYSIVFGLHLFSSHVITQKPKSQEHSYFFHMLQNQFHSSIDKL